MKCSDCKFFAVVKCYIPRTTTHGRPALPIRELSVCRYNEPSANDFFAYESDGEENRQIRLGAVVQSDYWCGKFEHKTKEGEQ